MKALLAILVVLLLVAGAGLAYIAKTQRDELKFGSDVLEAKHNQMRLLDEERVLRLKIDSAQKATEDSARGIVEAQNALRQNLSAQEALKGQIGREVVLRKPLPPTSPPPN